MLTAVGLVVLTALLLRPARTDPITDGDGDVVPGSIAELDTVDGGGHDLALMIRGHSVENPVLRITSENASSRIGSICSGRRGEARSAYSPSASVPRSTGRSSAPARW